MDLPYDDIPARVTVCQEAGRFDLSGNNVDVFFPDDDHVIKVVNRDSWADRETAERNADWLAANVPYPETAVTSVDMSGVRRLRSPYGSDMDADRYGPETTVIVQERSDSHVHTHLDSPHAYDVLDGALDVLDAAASGERVLDARVENFGVYGSVDDDFTVRYRDGADRAAVRRLSDEIPDAIEIDMMYEELADSVAARADDDLGDYVRDRGRR